MTVVFTIVLATLALAGALALARFLRGPSTLDRLATLDVLVVLIVAATAVYVAYYQDGSNIPLLVTVSMIVFVGTATAARLLERWERHR